MSASWYFQALLSHSSKHRYSWGEKKKKQHPPKKGTAAPKRTAPSRLCSAGKGPPGHEHKPCSGRWVKQFRIENIPFDSTPSLSRSSRLSPAPTGRQNTTVSWTSSAWLPMSVCFSRRSDSWFRYLNSLFDTVGIRAELRRTDPAGFVSRSGGTEGGSRKQPTNISEVRGQRLAESNPIKHRLRRPRRRAGAASDYSRASWWRAGQRWVGVQSQMGGKNPPLILDGSSLVFYFYFFKERRLSCYVIPD